MRVATSAAPPAVAERLRPRAAAQRPLGVLLLSFGSARSEEEVPAYLERIRHGQPVTPAMITDLRARYRAIGGSPLTDITALLAGLLQLRLDPGRSGAVLVRPAMLHSDPGIPAAIHDLLAAGARQVVGVPLAPQVSPHHAAYVGAVRAAVAERVPVLTSGSWHLHPLLLDELAARVRPLLGSVSGPARAGVLFTAHSLPVVAAGVGAYRRQVEETSARLASILRLNHADWRMAFQSQSDRHARWLGPDLAESVAALAGSGHSRVVLVPVQFLCDHLEVLYDLDIVARNAAEAAGMRYLRPASLNASPVLVRVLADVVATTLEAAGSAEIGNGQRLAS